MPSKLRELEKLSKNMALAKSGSTRSPSLARRRRCTYVAARVCSIWIKAHADTYLLGIPILQLSVLRLRGRAISPLRQSVCVRVAPIHEKGRKGGRRKFDGPLLRPEGHVPGRGPRFASGVSSIAGFWVKTCIIRGSR
ncbi:hypothetical protein KM043_013170 [Ampulex compressa]|nr:hypothetical protein KM043_013170 [Ampulex compressa]